MFAMFKKVNAREKVVGWYSTGPKIRPPDIEINELMRRYTSDPVLCIIDVNPREGSELEIPVVAYLSVEASRDEQAKSAASLRTGRTFRHVPVEIGALEAEEVGVEHLLRNIRDTVGTTLADQIAHKLNSLRGLKKRVEQLQQYVSEVLAGTLPPNHQIIYNIQKMFNLSPDLTTPEMLKAFAVKTNDQLLVIYMSSLIRSIITLHNLIDNKIQNNALEQEKKNAHQEKHDKDDNKEDEDKNKDKEKDHKEKDHKEKDHKDKDHKDKEKDHKDKDRS